MDKTYHHFLKMGIVHFMAYPQTLKGEGPIYETIKKIAEDEFFTAIEIGWIKDKSERERVKKLLATSHLSVAYGAQPRLLTQGLNLNSSDNAERKKAIDEIKQAIDEAEFLGAKSIAILSGKRPTSLEEIEEGKKIFTEVLFELCEYAQNKGLNFTLEVFDFDVDKCALIGTSEEAGHLAKNIRKHFENFGLMMDLSHLPLVRERAYLALHNVADYLSHAHLGNCVVKDKSHPAYGDMHPRFGCEGGENDVSQVVDFLQALFEVGFLSEHKNEPPIVSFEVKPIGEEEPEVVIANAKRVFLQAWAKV